MEGIGFKKAPAHRAGGGREAGPYLGTLGRNRDSLLRLGNLARPNCGKTRRNEAPGEKTGGAGQVDRNSLTTEEIEHARKHIAVCYVQGHPRRRLVLRVFKIPDPIDDRRRCSADASHFGQHAMRLEE